jgi:hypothetical protein
VRLSPCVVIFSDQPYGRINTQLFHHRTSSSGNIVDSPGNPKPKTPQKPPGASAAARSLASAAAAPSLASAPPSSHARSAERNSDIDDILAVRRPCTHLCKSHARRRYSCMRSHRLLPPHCLLPGHWRHSGRCACSLILHPPPPLPPCRRRLSLHAAVSRPCRRPFGLACLLQVAVYQMRFCRRPV